MWQYFSAKLKLVSCVALVFVLMLNVAAVAHAFDDDPAHHLHHQCELFSIAQQGLAHSSPVVPDVDSHHYVFNALEERDVERLYFAFLARSPPKLIS